MSSGAFSLCRINSALINFVTALASLDRLASVDRSPYLQTASSKMKRYSSFIHSSSLSELPKLSLVGDVDMMGKKELS